MLKDIVTSMTLVNGVSQDERQAWERFVRVYRDPMCEFARSQAAFHGISETEAEDAVFTLFERFAQHKEKFDPAKGTLRNWVTGALECVEVTTRGLATDSKWVSKVLSEPQKKLSLYVSKDEDSEIVFEIPKGQKLSVSEQIELT